MLIKAVTFNIINGLALNGLSEVRRGGSFLSFMRRAKQTPNSTRRTRTEPDQTRPDQTSRVSEFVPLGYLFERILVVPASSAPVERVFFLTVG